MSYGQSPDEGDSTNGVKTPKQNTLSKEKKIALSEELKNNKDTLGLITGLQLGDSTIQLIGKNARLRICMKDKAIVDHIYENFKGWGIVGAEPYQSKSIIEPTFFNNLPTQAKVLLNSEVISVSINK